MSMDAPALIRAGATIISQNGCEEMDE